MTAVLSEPRGAEFLDEFTLLLDRENEPMGFEAGDANLYRYVGNEPTGFVDPSGLVKRDKPPEDQSDLSSSDFASGFVQGLGRLTGKPADDPNSWGALRKNRPRMTPGVGNKFHDAPSQTDLRNKSLNCGTTALQRAGLKRVPQPDGSYNFLDQYGRIRARWVPQSGEQPQHWSKFEPSGQEKNYLDNSGRPVENDDPSHRIPSS